MMIDTVNLTRRFGRNIAVNELNLQVPEGAIYGFLGPNGAGKTTTIRLILGLIRPHGGNINLFGKSIAEHREDIIRKMGVVFETPPLYYHLTGYENLEINRLILNISKDKIIRVLEYVRLKKDAHRLVKEYSMGMRQRLSIALALMSEPELLIMDEPMNALDPSGIHDLRELIKYLNKEHNVTVFLSSHILAEVEMVATHIGIINAGKMIYQGLLNQFQMKEQVEIFLSIDKPVLALSLVKDAGWMAYQYPGNKIMVDAKTSSDLNSLDSLLTQNGLSISNVEVRNQLLEDFYMKIITG